MNTNRPKVLFICFECNPFRGSECANGWNWPYYLSKDCDCIILTRLEHKKELSKYMQDNDIKNIKIYYYDVTILRYIYEKFGKLWMFYYYWWLRKVQKFIKKIMIKENVDIVHHISMNEFRKLDNSYSLTNYVFGPSGGAQSCPTALVEMIKNDSFSEKVRDFLNSRCMKSKSYKRKLLNTNLFISCNVETYDIVNKIANNNLRNILMSDLGITKSQILTPKKSANSKLHFLFSGRLVERKGVMMLLDAVKMISNLDFTVNIVGSGKQRDVLEEYARKIGITEHVKFIGQVPHDVMMGLYEKNDVFVFPSIRESGGSVLVEAISKGLPCICLCNGGPQIIVDDNCGMRFEGTTYFEYCMNLAECMKKYICNSELVISQSENAIKKCNEFIWENKAKIVLKEYYNIISRK